MSRVASNVSSADQQLIEKMGDLHEDIFTDKYLRPLFCAMGYDRVEFYGGPHERGKDLIASRRIPPRIDDYIALVQSKRTRGLSGAKGAQKLSTLLHQLRQCAVQGIDRGDGKLMKPNEIYLASPDIVPQRLRDEIAGQLVDIRPTAQILDGVEILRWIKEFAPELLRSLSSIQDRLISIDSIDVKNSELLRALSSQRAPDLTQLYRDLSFFVGSVDSNALLHLKIKIDSNFQSIDPVHWPVARRQAEQMSDLYGIYIFKDRIEDIEKECEKKRTAYESAINQSKIKLLTANRDRVDDGLAKLELHIIGLENAELNRTASKFRKDTVDSAGEILLSELGNIREILRSESEDLLEKMIFSEIKNRSLKTILSEIRSIFDTKKQIAQLELEVVAPPKFIVSMNCQKILDHIALRKSNYFEGVRRISGDDRSSNSIRQFLSETEHFLGFIAFLRSKEFELNKAFSFEGNKVTEDRVSISPHDVFDSRRNVAVYGGAGVGKTTTLKAYVSRSVKSGRKDIVYVPLNRVTETFISMKRDLRSLKSQDKDVVLDSSEQSIQEMKFNEEDLIAMILLASRGLEITQSSVREAHNFLKNGVTLVLDGLDEIFDTLKEILPAIAAFAEKNPNSQLIVSSRDCVSYLSNIRFLGITLLPFTKEQLVYFVQGWVTSEEKRDTIISSIENGELFEHIRTPLLATIACSLAEKGIKVVSNEREIYYERLRLLTGAYDESKGIKRQKQTSELLMSVARRVAFELHSGRSRSLHWNNLLDRAKSALDRRMDSTLVEQALNELIDPCNVLVLDQDTQEIGFGHFRFQEHLVSEEFAANREIQVALYAGIDWWRGAICLYAQQVDAEALFKEVYSLHGQIGQAYRTLSAIVAESSSTDRARLRDALSMYVNGDGFDSMLLDDEGIFSGRSESEDIFLDLGIEAQRFIE